MAAKNGTELPGDQAPSLDKYLCLESWNSTSGQREAVHFNAESKNSELLFKIIFSANQLSVYEAAANWCYQLGSKKSEEPGNPSVHEEIVNKGLMNSVEADEVNSLVSTARLIAAPGNRLSGDVKTFDDMPWHSQFCTLCDLVSWRKVQSDGFFITKPSSTDGHGGIDTQCKEKTFSRSDPRGRTLYEIPGGTNIGPVSEIKVVRIVGIYALESAVPSIRD